MATSSARVRMGRCLLDLESLASRDTPTDHAVPNGSSIAFIAEYDGKRVLFASTHTDPESKKTAGSRV